METKYLKLKQNNKTATNRIDNFAINGLKKLAIVTPAFVSDCLETLEEIGMEAKHSFKENGGQDFNMIPCLNDDKKWVQTLSGWIKDWAETE